MVEKIPEAFRAEGGALEKLHHHPVHGPPGSRIAQTPGGHGLHRDGCAVQTRVGKHLAVAARRRGLVERLAAHPALLAFLGLDLHPAIALVQDLEPAALIQALDYGVVYARTRAHLGRPPHLALIGRVGHGAHQ